MPLYEYNCSGCGEKVEILVPSHKTRPNCPKCGSKKLKRLLSTFATHQGQPQNSCGIGNCPSQRSCPGGSCPLSS
ncbi:MAG TPA: zinc ribbon domain-containing protein [Phycisphaerae bacterium]|nr:zinc ribbon domain-containing protein [Phycisphaerae bacterium]